MPYEGPVCRAWNRILKVENTCTLQCVCCIKAVCVLNLINFGWAGLTFCGYMYKESKTYIKSLTPGKCTNSHIDPLSQGVKVADENFP